MFKKLLQWLGIESKTYVSVQDLVASYDPATQQVGVKRGTLDAVNRRRFMTGERFEFNGTPSEAFVILPKQQRDSEGSDA
jgi:hypothetical protein